MDIFHGCYKLQSRDCRYFAGLYLFLKLLNHFFIALTTGPFYYPLSGLTIVMMAILVATVRPHKSPWHTFADSVFFATLSAIFLGVPVFRYILAIDAKNKVLYSVVFSLHQYCQYRLCMDLHSLFTLWFLDRFRLRWSQYVNISSTKFWIPWKQLKLCRTNLDTVMNILPFCQYNPSQIRTWIRYNFTLPACNALVHHFVLVLVIDCDSGSIVLHYLIVYTSYYYPRRMRHYGNRCVCLLSVLSVCLFGTLISRTPALVV